MPAVVLSTKSAIHHANRGMSARPVVIATYNTWTSSVGVNMCTKHTPSLVWASNEKGGLQRESAFFWVLVGIMARIPFYLFLLGGWLGGRCSLGEGITFPHGWEGDVKSKTGWDRTRREWTGQGSKTQVCTSKRRQTRQDRANLQL